MTNETAVHIETYPLTARNGRRYFRLQGFIGEAESRPHTYPFGNSYSAEDRLHAEDFSEGQTIRGAGGRHWRVVEIAPAKTISLELETIDEDRSYSGFVKTGQKAKQNEQRIYVELI